MLIIYKVRAKENALQAFKDLVERTLVPEALRTPGCKLFAFYQNTSDRCEFIFHELWGNEEDVHIYKKKLITLLGKPHPGEEFPAAMNDMIESDEDLV